MCQVLCPGGIPLELGQVEEALRLVQGEPAAEKALESLLCGVEVPLVAALLLGKLPARYAPIGEGLTSILGHLLENALEAAQSAVGCRFLKVPTTDRAFPREKKPFFFPGTGLRPRPWPGRRRGSSIPPRD